MDARVPLRLLWRDWKGGELTLLVAALMLAVTTVTGIAVFIDRLERALVLESNAFLAADRRIESSRPIPDDWRAQAAALGLDTADTLTFSSMVFAGDRSQLVSVKAVTDGYPLRGTLKIADRAFVPGTATDRLPAPGSVWMDGRLLPSLNVAPGAVIAIGNAELVIDEVVTDEPDRGGSFFDLGPRVLMRMADVPATGVVQPGSRLEYGLLLRGEEAALETFHDAIEDQLGPVFDWDDIRSSNDSIGGALDRAQSFLLLGGLLAVILAGVAVALAANRYSQRQHDPVAVLKTFGMTPSEVQRLYLSNLVVLGGIAAVSGMVLGWALQAGALWALRDMVPVRLPPPGIQPFLVGGVTGFVCLLSFALPPLLRLRGVSPLRVIRRDLDPGDASMAVAYGSGMLGSLVLLIWYSGSLELTGWLLLGTFGTVVVLLGVASLLLRTGRIVGMQAGSGWRIALAGLQRRSTENRVQILVFGLAIMLLLILYLTRTALLDEWQQQMPPDAPNHFVLNVAPYEVDGFRELLETEAQGSQPFYPMTRGRVVAVNGEPVSADGDERRWLSRERNLSWSEALPPANKITDGSWWTASAVADPSALPQVSLDDEFARENGLEIGDRLRFSIADRELETVLVNTRKVDWDSMRPNFYVLLSPGALEDFPATFLTSFRLDGAQKPFLNTLLQRYPTVSVIEVDAVLEQIQRIIERVTLAVEMVLLLVMIAGAMVLVASIQSSMDERLREFGLLRALGAGRRRILGALVIEFSALGLFAGVLAAVGAEITVYGLTERVFQLQGSAHPWVWLGGPLIGVLLIGLIGTLSTRRVVDTPPAIVLRETG
ncbi:MAG TPA: FtsX-like permease family protein [Pseudomonadales bacterium]|nr:FtsX-like permease family protein [Pseudomonadales bacterium]